ncbi:MAG: hypothetical protein O2799_06905, partial [Planctomycetota bacterium]|nr:hypothetical protein [Planctomycetota bacterium]
MAVLALALLLAGASLPSEARGDEYPFVAALDGEPGLGSDPTLRAVERLWRRPEDGDLDQVRSWWGLLRSVDLHQERQDRADARLGLPGLARRVAGLGPSLEPGGALAESLAFASTDPFSAGLDAQQALVLVRALGDARRAARVVLLEEA